MPETANYKWERSDLLGNGAYGFVYKVSCVDYSKFFVRTMKCNCPNCLKKQQFHE